MSALGWLILLGLIVFAGLAALGWLAAVIGEAYKAGSELVAAVAAKVFHFLGKKNLVPNISASIELTKLESVLNNKDVEAEYLKHYDPVVNYPPILQNQIYVEELPKLFRQAGSKEICEINIGYEKELLRIEETPSHELLKIIIGDLPKNFPVKAPNTDPEIAPPPGWSELNYTPTDFQFSIPRYGGILSPLNFFVDKIFGEVVEKIVSLKKRQARAIELAAERNKKVEMLSQKAIEKYKRVQALQSELWDEYRSKHAELKSNYDNAALEEKNEIQTLVRSAQLASSEGLIAKVEQTIKLECFPSYIPVDFSLKYDQESRILILEHEFPDVGNINWKKSVNLKNGLSSKPANQKEIKEASIKLYPSISLRLAYELARIDKSDLVDAIVVNGWSQYIEKSTGQKKRAYCSSLFASKDQILNLNLAAIDPVVAFSSLKGVAAKSLELTPIAPILRLNTDDKRFVDPKEVLSHLDVGENIAAMDWEEFEHLCRELFEKAFAGSGAEVKVTQASRDQGVDAVIFDPDVLRGGKIVVQAKRYTNTVDVSAVRDLYGAIINEGATKGILVTTSHYGPDAYSFAKDKPITLLSGEELLGLLEKYGYKFRIDLAEAKRLNAENSSFGRGR
jgi:restriction system protein